MSMKNSMTPSGIEPATFQFVAQHLNHCATAVPCINMYGLILWIVRSVVIDLSYCSLCSEFSRTDCASYL